MAIPLEGVGFKEGTRHQSYRYVGKIKMFHPLLSKIYETEIQNYSVLTIYSFFSEVTETLKGQ